MKKKVIISMSALAALFVVTILGALGLASSLGGFNSVDSAYDKQCHLITGMPGSEDIEIDRTIGFAYVSSDDRWGHAENPDERGAIFRLNMNSPQPTPVPMKGTEGLSPFHPHGLSLYQDNGRTLLFVISHRLPSDPTGGHDIYAFNIVEDRLELVNHFEDSGFRSPNDLVAVSPEQFYFTNDRKALKGVAMLFEVLLSLNDSNVSYFDGESVSQVAGDLAFANGIAASADGSKLYVTASRDGSLSIYERDMASGNLSMDKVISVGNSPDNITRDDQGLLWIADHYNGLKQLSHVGDTSVLSPVRVYRVDPSSGSVDVIYEDDGSTLSAVSVAVPYGEKLILGAIVQDGIQICDQ